MRSQAEITRHIKAALKAAADMKLLVTCYRVTFADGVPCVEVQTASDSVASGTGKPGGDDVEALTQRIRRAHGGRS